MVLSNAKKMQKWGPLKLSMSLALVSVALLTACGGGSDNKKESAPAYPPVNAQNHKGDECPLINGTFEIIVSETNHGGGRIDRESEEKRVTTTRFGNGVKFNDNADSDALVDGQFHGVDGQTDMTYIGVCTKGKLSLSIFQNGTLVANVHYSMNNKDQLVTETQSNDSRVTTETKVWPRKR